MIYLFDLLEFQILAAARDITVFYGFPIPDAVSKEDTYLAVHQLTRSGILKPEAGGLAIQEPISGYMDGISRSACVMVVDRGKYRLPRQCIYHDGQSYICLENSRTDSEMVCLSGMVEEDIIQQMQDLNQMPEPHLAEGMGDYGFDEYWAGHIPAVLMERLMEGWSADTEELLEYDEVHTVFSLRDKGSGELVRRLILLDLPLEYCMIQQPAPHEIHLECYARESALGILRAWWRNEG